MRQRTAEIIQVLKGHHDYGESLSYERSLQMYLLDRCGMLPYVYCRYDYKHIILEAAKDYIDSMTEKPSVFIEMIQMTYAIMNDKSFSSKKHDLIDAICMALSRARTKDDNGAYINGFDEDNTKPIEKIGVMAKHEFPEPDDTSFYHFADEEDDDDTLCCVSIVSQIVYDQEPDHGLEKDRDSESPMKYEHYEFEDDEEPPSVWEEEDKFVGDF